MAGGGVLSFNALVVPEDPSNNGYILKPLVVCLLEACGKPNAKVDGALLQLCPELAELERRLR
jgi:hypothetical protein